MAEQSKAAKPATTPMRPHGHFHWNERNARDVEGVKAFYAKTLGWTYEPFQSPGAKTYWVAKAGDVAVAGIFDISGPEYDPLPEGWFSYIAVDEVDRRVRLATAAGAILLKPLFDVPGVGRIAIVQEPGGAHIGWMTPEYPGQGGKPTGT